MRPIIVSGMSAACLWGMPIFGDWPTDVTVLDEWHGGGRAEPGVRRTTAGFRTARAVEIDGVRVTDLTRTALDVARRGPFRDVVGSVDWSLATKNPNAVTVADLADDARNFDVRLGRSHLNRVILFATPFSGSFGESQCRAAMHLQGFDAPQLQAEFVDVEGSMFTDFFWPTVNVAGEFDGKQKYTRDEYTKGDPGEVVWREKRREDRLRRQVSGVVRPLTVDVLHPERLSRLLLGAGVPRGGRTLQVAR